MADLIVAQVRYFKVSDGDEYARYEFHATSSLLPGHSRLEPIDVRTAFAVGYVSKTWDRIYGNHWIAWAKEGGDQWHPLHSGKTRAEAAYGAAKIMFRDSKEA